MPSTLFPIPIDTPVMDKSGKLSEAWARYFKGVGDVMTEANIVRRSLSDKRLQYTLSVNCCDCTWYSPTATTAPVDVDLPFEAVLPFDVAGMIYESGTRKVTIPPGSKLVRWWFQAKTN